MVQAGDVRRRLYVVNPACEAAASWMENHNWSTPEELQGRHPLFMAQLLLWSGFQGQMGRQNWSTPVLHQPMEDLDEGQDGEERHKLDIELIPEDCHGQTCLDDGLANPLIHSLHLSLSESA
jgi:hypothetical protein